MQGEMRFAKLRRDKCVWKDLYKEAMIKINQVKFSKELQQYRPWKKIR